MKSLKKKRRVQIVAIAAVALVMATALIGYGMRDGINFFRSPTQVLAEPPSETEVFRIGGLVEEGSLKRGQGEVIHFNVTDGGGDIQGRAARSLRGKSGHGRHRQLQGRCVCRE